MELSHQEAPISEEKLKKSVTSKSLASKSGTRSGTRNLRADSIESIELTPSEDYDTTGAVKKPPPRLPEEPTYRGWKEVGTWERDDELTADDEIVDLLSKSSIFDQYLPAVAYGDWYHNVAYLILAGLLSWLIGWFRFSLAPMFVVMIVFSILYRTSVRKYRTSLREQAQREFAIKSIENDYETMDWCNVFLEKFWSFLEPSVSQIVCEQVNPILAASPAPAFIKSLWIDSFTAGTKPPRIDAVKTLSGTSDDVVVMDWTTSFTPNALADSNTKQMKNNVNQKVIVKAKLFGITIPIAVSDVSYKASIRVRMRMMAAFPHIETVNVTLLEPIQFDFNSRILGDTIFNWEVLSVPGLYPFINEMIKKYVGPIVYAPLSFQLNVQQLVAGYPLDSAVGVLQITAKGAKDIKGFHTIGNTLDPYLTYGFNSEILGKTKHKNDTDRPVWNESTMITVKSLSEPLSISVWDHNGKRKDRQLGTVQFDLETLQINPRQNKIVAPFIRNNKPVGELEFGLKYMPTIPPKRNPDGAIIPPPDLNTGVIRVEILEGRNFNKDDKNPSSSYAEIYFNDDFVKKSDVTKKNNNPFWNLRYEAIINNKSKAKVRFVIKDKDESFLGSITTTLNELIDASLVNQTWFGLSKGGEIRINAVWKPVDLPTKMEDSLDYTPPIGVVRISIEKAEDLRNLERIGKIDPYARVLINQFQRGRTVAADGTLSPTWNEVIYATISSQNQLLTIEVMDVEKRSADRTLGSFDVRLSEIINKNELNKYIEHFDTDKRVSKLISKKGPKGEVTYSLSFYPVLPIIPLKEQKEIAAKEKKEAEEKAKAEAQKTAEQKEKEAKELEAKNKKDKEDIASGKKAEPEPEKRVRQTLSLDQLLEYQSGVLVCEISEGSFSKESLYLQAFFDNHPLYDFVSKKLKKGKSEVALLGDVVIKELEHSTACFRLTKDKEDNRVEKCVAELNIPTIQLLKNGYHEPTVLKLSGDGVNEFLVHCQWIPVIYETGLPPQDSIQNCGKLTLEVIRGENFIAADSNGKSDPFVRAFLNTSEDEFMKTKKVKKTLDPVYNEQATVDVPNKYDSIIRFEAYDWDIGIEQDDFLASGSLRLSDVDWDADEEIEVPLYGENEEDGGSVFVKVSFKPEFIINARPASATDIGDAFGAVGGVGKGVGKGVVGGVGKGAGLVGGVGKSLVKLPFRK